MNRNQGLRGLYAPFLIVVFVVTIVICAVLFTQARDVVNENMVTAMDANLNQIAAQLEQQMAEMTQLSKIVSINPEFQAMLPSVQENKRANSKDILVYYRLQDAFSDIRNVNTTYHLHIYMNDNVIFSGEGKLFFPMSEIADQTWYDAVQQTGGRMLWCLYRGGEGIAPVLTLATSTIWRDAMGLRAVVFVGLKSSHLRATLLNPFAENGGYTLLYTRDGELLSSGTLPGWGDARLPDGLFQAVQRGDGAVELAGMHYLAAAAELNGGLHLLSLVPKVSAWEAIRSNSAATLLILSAFLLVLVGIGVQFASRYERRIRNLVQHIETIEGGGFARMIDARGQDEIAVIERKFNEMSLRLRHMMDEIHESDRRKREAELNALQSQMNPHFLHNTLDAINWMAIDVHEFEIAEAVATLGSFFRMVLSTGSAIITVQEELDLTRQYVKIQLIRNRDKLDVRFDIAEECLPLLCVKLLMQPLIENAIKHSHRLDGPMRIEVRMARTGDYLQLSVADNGSGIRADQAEPPRGYQSGYGLKSVEQRLMLHFGQDIMMSLGEGLDGRGTCVLLKWRATRDPITT